MNTKEEVETKINGFFSDKEKKDKETCLRDLEYITAQGMYKSLEFNTTDPMINFMLVSTIVKSRDAKCMYLFAKNTKETSKSISPYRLSKARSYEGYIGELVEEIGQEDQQLLIEFIEKNENDIRDYDSLVEAMLRYMQNNLEEYEGLLKVYIDYIIKPTEFSKEEKERLDEEYNKLMTNGNKVPLIRKQEKKLN